MATLDTMKQAAISSQGRYRSGVFKDGRLFSRPTFIIAVWAGLDFISALVAGLIAFRIRLEPAVPVTIHGVLRHIEATAPLTSIAYLLVFSVYLVIFARIFGLYRSPDGGSGLHEQRLTVQTVLTSGLMLCGTLYVMQAIEVSRIVVALTISFTLVLLMVRRAIERKMMQRRFLQGRETRNVLIVGNGRVAHALRNHLQSLPHMGFRFMGFVSLGNEAEANENPQVIGNIRNCVALARSLFVDEIYFSTPADKQTVIGVVAEARDIGIDVRVVPDLYDGLAWNAPVEFIGQFPTIPLHQRDFPKGAFFIKRVMDVLLSTLAVVVAAPFFALIALAIRMDSKGPIFYRAARIGRKGRTFTCFKFRTMVAGADKMQEGLDHHE